MHRPPIEVISAAAEQFDPTIDVVTRLCQYALELERRAKALCDAAESYVRIGFDHDNESAPLRATVAAVRSLLEADEQKRHDELR